MSERAVFVRSLFGTLKPGHILVMGGKAKSEAQEIDIRLCNKERNSIDLRLLIRFENNQIVRNTRTNRRWGAEEIEENLEPNACLNPITPGAHFRLYILLETSKFRIAFDGKPFCTYAYRLPLEGICAFSVSYGVEKITQLDHRQVYPSPWPPIQMDEPNLSFSADFPIQFSPGHCIYIAGTCSENSAGQFVIFFVDGSSNPSKKLSFYFNQRCASQIVALNIATNIAHGDLQWEGQESGNSEIGRKFMITIEFETDAFKFSVNDRLIARFTYRSTNLLDHLTGFKIRGINGTDLTVSRMEYTKSLKQRSII